jgi:hypothetical protein
MSKLIVEMEMPDNCKICPMVRMDHFGQIRCGAQGGRIIHRKNFQVEIKRPSWCPIKGVLPDEHGDLIDRTSLYADVVGVILSHSGLNFSEVLARQKAVIAAERKYDGTTVD